MVKALPNPQTDAPALPEGNPCLECGGRCCSFKTLRIAFQSVDDQDKPLPLEERVRATLQRGAAPDNLYRQSGDPVSMHWYTDGSRLWFHCEHLTDAGKCGIYEDRPDLCRNFECAVLRGKETLDTFLSQLGAEREIDDLGDDVTEVTDIVNDELQRLRD